MTHLYCATGNRGKLREFRLAAGHAPVEIELVPGFRELPAAVEDGATFEENAIKKALHYGRHVDGLLFADDSGLAVDALGGAPGVYSARYSGEGATDESNNALLLANLRGVANRELQSCGRAHRIAEHVSLLETHRVHERGYVIRQVLVRDRPIDVRRAAVPL